MSRKYRAPESDELILHPLDSMTLIFQKASGITHVVADPVPAILDVMASTAMDADTIAEKLSENFDVEQDLDIAEIVLARLEELCVLGLVERVSG